LYNELFYPTLLPCFSMWTKSHSSVSIWKWRTKETSLFSLHRTKIKGHDIGHKQKQWCVSRDIQGQLTTHVELSALLPVPVSLVGTVVEITLWMVAGMERKYRTIQTHHINRSAFVLATHAVSPSITMATYVGNKNIAINNCPTQ